MPTWLIVVIVIAVVVLLLVGIFVGLYNGLIRLRNKVEESWHQVDVELKRRHDLIPNLVETVKGYAAHEQGTFEAVMKARATAMSASGPAASGEAEGQLSQALGRLFAVAEAYPDLKANQNFLALQQELTSTEDRIAAGRRYYNANVRELNTAVETFPRNIVANMFHITRRDYFEADEASREAPQVSFGQTAPAAGGSAVTPGVAQPGGVPQGATPPVAPTAPAPQPGTEAPTGQMPPMRDPQDPRA